MTSFVAVHCGAGYHAPKERKVLLELGKSACGLTWKSLSDESDALTECAMTTKMLEDCPYTNTGVGSNLTREKRVECDAGLMDGEWLDFSGCASVSCVKNPILIPLEMILQRRNKSSKLVLPQLLCGRGALDFATSSNIPIVNEADLITSQSLKMHKKCENSLKEKKKIEVNGDGLKNGEEELEESCRLDTIGCITLDSFGRVAASCSSGGILLKHAGRVGHAALYGCGCWAENGPTKSVAISVSGCGEYLTKTHFAQSCFDYISSLSADISLAECLTRFFDERFVNSRYLQYSDSKHKIAGAIVVVADVSDSTVEFVCIHNSTTMCVAYATDNACKSYVSKSPNGQIVVSGKVFKLKRQE